MSVRGAGRDAGAEEPTAAPSSLPRPPDLRGGHGPTTAPPNPDPPRGPGSAGRGAGTPVVAEHWEEPSLRRVGAEPGPATASTQGAVGSGCGTRPPVPVSPFGRSGGRERGTAGLSLAEAGQAVRGRREPETSSTFSWLHPPAAGVRSGRVPGALRPPQGWRRLTRAPTAPKGRAGSVLPVLRPRSLPLEAGVCPAVPPHGPGAAAVRCRHSLQQVLVWPKTLPGGSAALPSSPGTLRVASCCSEPLSPPASPIAARVAGGESPNRGSESQCSCSLQTQLCRRCPQRRGGWRSPRPPSRVPRGCCWHHTTPTQSSPSTEPGVPVPPPSPSQGPPCHRPALSGTSPAVGCCSRPPRCVTC